MLAEILAKIGEQTAFAARHTLPADALRIRITGVGQIALPISSAKAKALCRVAKPARYGFKDKTLLDASVRDTWEIAGADLEIDQTTWERALAPALDDLARDLGLGPDRRLRAELHNLLVYAPGQFFLPHQDSEKSNDMLGTLVVTLPSKFTGGAIVVRHHDEEVAFRASHKDIGLIAFYADCHHEVRSVEAGHRIVLTYNLVAAGTGAKAASLPAEQLTVLERSLRTFFDTTPPARWPGASVADPPDRLVYLLDHQYSQKGLSWSRLKGADHARAAALRDVAGRLDCEITLALADAHESWSCEDEDVGWRGFRHRHRRRYDEDDEDADPDGQSSLPELLELLDSSVELRHFADARGKAHQASGFVDHDELCFTKPSAELDPFQSRHEGYMGNWGNTVDHWYHRAAVVLWPRARAFVIRAKTSASWTIAEIGKVLARGAIDEGRRMTRDVVSFWSRIANVEPTDVAADAIRVARALEDRDLAAALLQPFRIEHFSSRAAAALAALVAGHGMRWFRTACGSMVATDVDGHHDRVPEERRLHWLRSLPAFVRALRSRDGNEELVSWVLSEQWLWTVSRYQLSERGSPSTVLSSIARLDRPILALVESSLLVGTEELHGEIASFLASNNRPSLAVAGLLSSATAKKSGASLRLDVVQLSVVQRLTQELHEPCRAPDDWAIAPPSRCSCNLCRELARFLRDRDRTRHEWPLATDGRAHVHGVLDGNELPVTHTTRRSGRPYTLVLVKTRALFEREKAQRSAREQALAALTGNRRSLRGRHVKRGHTASGADS